MEFNPQALQWCALWVLAAGSTVVVHWRRNRVGSGLVIGYVLTTGLFYLPGAAMFIWPAAELLVPKEIVLSGFRQCVYGTAAFAVGSIVFAPMLSPGETESTAPESSEESSHSSCLPSMEWQMTIARIYLVSGLISYPLLGSFIGRLPSMQAVIAMSQYLVVVGVCLLCWIAWRRGNRGRLWIISGIALLFPLATMLTRGFAGYGVRALLIIAAFLATFYRPRWHMVALGTVLVYAGLSFYIGYMYQRAELRDAVWGGRGYGSRWRQVEDIFRKTEAFDPTNPEHVKPVLDRLNFNYHLGVATEYTGTSQEYANGQTLWQAAVAIIPRALWPSKPAVAGSQDLVSTYTGLTFAAGTSVGIGHVMEWYINFGTRGVIIGFLLFGIIVTYLDNRASIYLERGNVQRFALWFLPSISFLDVGGQFASITSGFIAGWIAVWGINAFLIPFLTGEDPLSTPGTSLKSSASQPPFRP